MLPHTLAAAFTERFGYAPFLVRAPGRINLIGEHTDYNDGFVLPAAIDREIYFAVGLNNLNVARLHAHDKHESVEVPLTAVAPGPTLWANYLLGVVAQFQARGVAVPGFDCVFGGTVPMGAGLSSSAAVECGLAYALNHLLNTNLDRLTLALMGQQAEHTYAGVRSGLMDQFASLFGKAGHVVRLDCRSLDYAYFPFDTAAYGLVLCNTGVKHALASSEYNTRRAECETGVAVLQTRFREVKSLRDATLEQLDACRPALGDVVYRRSRYVVQENQRVLAACDHLTRHDMAAVGQLMYASHKGLRDDYEVSCRELDVLVRLAQAAPVPVLGARMMGGGFGGCTINLIATEHIEVFVAHATTGYEHALGLPLVTYQTVIVDGVGGIG